MRSKGAVRALFLQETIMIRQLVRFGRLGVMALGITAGLSGLSLTEAPVFGSTPAQSQEYERRNGFRCPTVGDLSLIHI